MLTYGLILGKLIILSLFGNFLLNPDQIQENLPVPIDPALVFPSPDLVEVVETLPLYIADQEQVSFYDYDTEEWHTYPYPEIPLLPDEIATINFTEHAGNTYLLKVDYYTPCIEICEADDCGEICEADDYYAPPRAAFVRERWHFDLNTGKFTPSEAICGGHAQALPGEGEWVITASDDEVYLCHTETGQRSISLVDVGRIAKPALLNSPSLSPDNRWLVFTFYDSLTLYVYDFVEDTLTSLGTLKPPSFSRDFPVISWLDNQQIMVENATFNYGDDHFYLYRADVSQPDILKLIYHGKRPFALKHPTHYVWVGQQFVDESGDALSVSLEENCTIYEYYPVKDTTKSYYIPDVCAYGWTIPDGSGDRLMLQYPHQENELAKLVRFNPDTGGIHEIIRIENLQGFAGFSPDGRYAVMTQDLGHYDYHIAVLDLQTHSFLEPFHPTNRQFAHIQWVDSRTFWSIQRNHYPDDTLFTISDTGLSAQEGKFYAPSGDTSPDDRFLLMESDQGTLDILDIETLETTTIAQPPDDAMIYGVWEDDGLITVTVWKDDYYRGRLGRWRVRINV